MEAFIPDFDEAGTNDHIMTVQISRPAMKSSQLKVSQHDQPRAQNSKHDLEDYYILKEWPKSKSLNVTSYLQFGCQYSKPTLSPWKSVQIPVNLGKLILTIFQLHKCHLM